MDSIHLEGKDKWLLRNAAYIGNSEQIGGLFMWMPSQYNYLYTYAIYVLLRNTDGSWSTVSALGQSVIDGSC